MRLGKQSVRARESTDADLLYWIGLKAKRSEAVLLSEFKYGECGSES